MHPHTNVAISYGRLKWLQLAPEQYIYPTLFTKVVAEEVKVFIKFHRIMINEYGMTPNVLRIFVMKKTGFGVKTPVYENL